MIFKPLCSSSAGNAYLVSDGETTILMECGVPFRRLKRLIGFGMAGISGCLLSHEHKDHANCYEELLKSGIPVFASLGTQSALSCEQITAVEEREPFFIGTLEILPFRTFHDAAEPFGFLVRDKGGDKLLFATDTVNLGYQFHNVTKIALECNYSERLLTQNRKLPAPVKRRIANSHMEIDRACAYLRTLRWDGLRHIWLLHLSDACANEGLFVDLVERACPGVAVTACPKTI